VAGIGGTIDGRVRVDDDVTVGIWAGWRFERRIAPEDHQHEPTTPPHRRSDDITLLSRSVR